MAIVSVPSRTALANAEYHNYLIEGEINGFLSEKYGFLPSTLPLQVFPQSHQLWDNAAKELPLLFQSTNIRKFFDKMPLLSASPQQLPDKYLWRCATLLGIFAHAYYWLEPESVKRLPDSIEKPWQECAKRLNRSFAFLSYVDLILYNWQLVNTCRIDLPQLDDLKLLVETVDKQEERIFYLTQVRMAMASAPIVSAVVRAQEAVHEENNEALKKELFNIICSLDEMIKIFTTISPNPNSLTYVDPVIWGRCVAPLAVSLQKDIKGPSGTSAPYFALLDSFLLRREFDSLYGQDQLYYRNKQFPKYVFEFITAVEKTSVRKYISVAKNSELTGLFQQLLETYAGQNGLLSIHKHIVYGYLDTAFKIGRSITSGGTAAQNSYITRDWEIISNGLNKARLERYETVESLIQNCNISDSKLLTKNEEALTKQITFNVRYKGMVYRPGDRLAVLPLNSAVLINKTLKHLKAKGDETIVLSEEWQQALIIRPDFLKPPKEMPLAEFLSYAQIRPLAKKTLEQLYRLSLCQELKSILDNYREDYLELWDLLLMLERHHFDITAVWKAKPWEKGNICHIIPPLDFRLYSISSAPQHDYDIPSLDLTIKMLEYKNIDQNNVEIQRKGTASNFLCNHQQYTNLKDVALYIDKTYHFSLPADPDSPLVMFAGGAGIAPFRGFLQARVKNASKNNWLFYSIHDYGQFYYDNELLELCRQGFLKLFLILTSEHTENTAFSDWATQFISRRIDFALLQPETQKILGQLIDSKPQAYFYVCGSDLFAQNVFDTMKEILRNKMPNGTELDSQKQMASLIANKHFMQDLYTPLRPLTFSPKHEYRYYLLSELVLHNNSNLGYWTIVNNQVYDITEFLQYHTGGSTILKSYAGMDATKVYQGVEHHLNLSIDPILNMYKIGGVKQLNFNNKWGIILRNGQLEYSTLEDYYKIWVGYLFFIIEINNSFNNELNMYRFHGDFSKENIYRYIESFAVTLHNFYNNAFRAIIDHDLQNLWLATICIGNLDEALSVMENKLKTVLPNQNDLDVYQAGAVLLKIKKNSDLTLAENQLLLTTFTEEFSSLITLLLNNLFEQLRNGILVFEQYQELTLENGITLLSNLLKELQTTIIKSHQDGADLLIQLAKKFNCD